MREANGIKIQEAKVLQRFAEELGIFTIFFRQDSVQAFMLEYILLREVSCRYKVNQYFLRLQAYGLEPIAGPHINGCHQEVFRRKDFDAAASRYALTHPDIVPPRL